MNGQETSTPDRAWVESEPAPPAMHSPSPLSQASPRRPRLFGPFLLVFAGLMLLVALSTYEAKKMPQRPWRNALFVWGAPQPPAKAFHAWARPLRVEESLSPFPEWMEPLLEEEGMKVPVDALSPRLIMLTLPIPQWWDAVVEGSLPTPGEPEVVAGNFLTGDTVTIAGRSFTVVGRLHPHLAGGLFSYWLPFHPRWMPLFRGASDAQYGWLVPNVDEQRESLEPFIDQITRGDSQIRVEPAEARTLPTVAWGTVFALILIAWGGSSIFLRSYRYAAEHPSLLFQSLCREIRTRYRMFILLHVVLYGVFFFAMIIAVQQPELNYLVREVVRDVFDEGGALAYVGQAYKSGNIWEAAGATFQNNYFVQTLGLTYFPSLIPLAPGFFKNIVSFWVSGFGMAPAWSGMTTGMTFHSITIVLELEAYILASFLTLLWPLYWLRVLRRGFCWYEFTHFLRVAVGNVTLSGMILLVAAFYEAATLITFQS